MALQTRERNLYKTYFFYVTLVLALITIPLKTNWNSYALILFGVSACFQVPFRKMLHNLKQHGYWVLSVLFFMFYLLSSWLYSGNDISWRPIEVYLSFLVFPFIFTITRKISVRGKTIACFSFVAITLAVSLICLIKAFLHYRVSENIDDFFYHALAGQMGLNAIYLSNYCLASLYWLIYLQPGNKEAVFKLPPYLTYIICVYLSAFIVLLSSKLIIALTLFFLLLTCLYKAYKTKSYLPVILGGSIILGSAALVFNLPFLKERINVTVIKTYSGPTDDANGFAARLAMWESAWELIQARPIFGYGAQGASNELIAKYREKDFYPGFTERYNAHNQYIDTTLAGGVIALSIFLALIFIPLLAAIKNRDILLLTMLLHFMLASLFESTLNVQHEQVFFWFFVWLFYYNKRRLPESP